MSYLLFLAFKSVIYLFSFILLTVIVSDVLKDGFLYVILTNFYEYNNTEFDYIVGSGSAGSVVALRLAENKNDKILVLEAGPYGSPILDIPILTPLLQKSFIDWQYNTLSQENACFGLKNQTSNWPLGRIFGGTSRLNNMIYLRGHENDFKDWFKNDRIYSYETDILPYFLKAENQIGKYKFTNYHSFGGPFTVNDLPYTSVFSQQFLKAIEFLGLPVRDINGLYSTGFMEIQANLKSGNRWTTAHQLKFLQKPNIFIKTNAFVEKILLKNNFEAEHVVYNYFGHNLLAKAKKGIIISAGVINSPKILMLSGIGPEDHLKNLQIPVKVNLPVGYNLQDHVTTGLDLVFLNKSFGISIYDVISPISFFKYFFNGKGPWTSPGSEIIGVVNTKTLKENVTVLNTNDLNILPDLQLMVLPTGINSDYGAYLRSSLNLKDAVWENYFRKFQNKTTVSVIPVLLHPKSKGRVYLKDSNSRSDPLIDPKYLSDKYDVEILIEGIEFVKKIIQTEPLQKLGAKLNPTHFPGCENYEFDTRNYWECYVRFLTLTSYHPVGTCSLGVVVESDFKVKNTNKLFVVDASVMPSLTSANINAAVVMLAEKAADCIKQDYKLSIGKCLKSDIFTGIYGKK